MITSTAHPTTPSAHPTSAVVLSAGTIDYVDTGGPGPVVVLLHGLLMDASLWSGVVDELAPHCRCVVPTLPLGAHRRAMPADADLSLPGIAALVEEFLERLDLDEVTLVGNDTGGALVQLVMAGGAARVAGAVLVSCDAFDNFPPGLTGKVLVLSGRLHPRLFGLFMQQMRLRAMRRLPISFGWLTKRGDRTVRAWLDPLLGQPEIRRDTVRVLRAIAGQRDLLAEVAERLPSFERPTLVVWAAEDRVMPPEHGSALAYLVPHAELVEVADSYTLVPLDQPAELARAIRSFVSATRPTAVSTATPPAAAPAPAR
jgi:pimeloyl-ACP methyl ester carboxylesterase